MPTADDLLSDEDDPIVDDLLPETIEGVASQASRIGQLREAGLPRV